jgi:hypothetical protein
MQVEAPLPKNLYLPDNGSPTSELVGKSIRAKSGPGGYSSHATTVGRNFYGDSSSMAPDIASVDAYRVQDYLSAGYLRTLEVRGPVLEHDPPKVQSHSWVAYNLEPGGGFSSAEVTTDVLRRLDYLIARDDVLSIVGVSNGSSMPRVLAGSYNAIAVGMSDAQSSVGPMTIDVPGRSKPDIVAPGKFPHGATNTSYAAPKVAAAAAILWQTGAELSDADAVHCETIKAVLLAGASKGALPAGRIPIRSRSIRSTAPAC